MASLLPTSDDGLELFAAHVAELLLELRDEGHLLSSVDQHLIEAWWEAGLPLEVVLRTLRIQAPRLKARKKPPRGLPLSAMKRAVEAAGKKALGAAVGRSVLVEQQVPDDVLAALRQDVRRALDAAVGPRREPLRQALAELGAPGVEGPEELFAALLGVGRRYYAACEAALPADERARRRAAVLDGLPSAARAAGPDALEATVRELSLRRLRADDPLFDPARYWTLP
jgi:hypothetical protein